MTKEKIEKWKQFALESMTDIAQLSDEQQRVLLTHIFTAIVELCDAITFEQRIHESKVRRTIQEENPWMDNESIDELVYRELQILKKYNCISID